MFVANIKLVLTDVFILETFGVGGCILEMTYVCIM